MSCTPFARSLLALALLAAGAAQAQSSLTLFGLADIGINNVTGQNGANTRLSSGVMEGSRWGMRGSEDMGGGYKAVFVLESRVELDTGSTNNRPASGNQVPDRLRFTTAQLGLPASPLLQGAIDNVSAGLGAQIGVNHIENNLFDRQAFIGLVTPVGAILMGRQYTPGYELFYIYDAMKTESSLSAAQIATLPPAIDIRRSNTLAYRVQKNGFTGTLSVALGEDADSTSDSRYLGANFYYDGTGWGAGAAYATNNNRDGETALRNVVAGAYADVGPGRLSFLYASAKDDNPDAAVLIRNQLAPSPLPAAAKLLIGNAFEEALRQDARLLHLGYRIQSGPHQITVAYNHFHDKLRDEADTQSYGAVYTYAFSKRTDVNLVMTQFRNEALAQAAPGGNGFFGGVTSEGGRDARNVAIALRHRF